MISKTEIEELAASSDELALSVGAYLLAAARILSRKIDKTYPNLSQEQKLFQARVAANVVGGTTPKDLKQLHDLLHLIHGYSRRYHPDPNVAALEAAKNQPPESTKGVPDVVIEEDLDGGRHAITQRRGVVEGLRGTVGDGGFLEVGEP